MFVDARSSPARVAAILFASDGIVLYTDGNAQKDNREVLDSVPQLCFM